MPKKTVAEGFDKFLLGLEPLKTEHNKAIKHKKSVNSCLTNNFGCYNFFETGSFGSGTGVRHHSDTDYFAVIPAKNLHTNSAYDLTRVKQALQYTFSTTTGIGVRCPAVKIPFGVYTSETMEITPCYFNDVYETTKGKFARYGIPDCNGGWMYSSPQAHNSYVNTQNDKFGNDKAKKLIQLIKAWKYYNNVPIKSFYLELRVTKYLETESVIVFDIDVKRILKSLQSHSLASMRDPMGISGLISASSTDTQKATALSKFNTAVSRAVKAIEAKDNGNIDDAFYWWNLLFNYNFPVR